MASDVESVVRGMDAVPEPFRPVTEPEALDDLRRRLRGTRWPEARDGLGWSLGADPAYLRELVAYWADGFDWPAREAEFARHPRYRLRLGGPDGVDVTFVHVRGVAPEGRTALPLVLTHGWPDSSWRYLKVIDLLTDPGAHGADPADAFDVVVPDMPGFGYSAIPAGSTMDSKAVARLWAELMQRLGYARYGAAGGDIGSSVSRFLALDSSREVVAVHRMDAGLPVLAGSPDELSGEERDWLARAAAWGAAEGAYAAMHRTKPLTAAVGLADSPAGLAAWVVEKLRAWSDCHGDLDTVYTRDEILTLLSVTWFTGSIGSSMSMYRANAAIPAAEHARRVEVPSGFSLFPGDILTPPRAWLERTTHLVRVTEPESGGHFAPFERPEIYARELRDFFRPFRA
ncbi:epoxide hydrolase family protein [Actinoplanes sp. URMC 104]|uniref:epoxide hydrolase family protein n=1 Tax=Actinoplanes sp. URMC 104 TaxID=3423409 RepID=UPI003F1A6C93